MTLPAPVRAALDEIWTGATPDSVEGLRLDFKQDATNDKETYRVALDAAALWYRA